MPAVCQIGKGRFAGLDARVYASKPASDVGDADTSGRLGYLVRYRFGDNELAPPPYAIRKRWFCSLDA